jgi:hybrid cluster-associated redox disulfide protein
MADVITREMTIAEIVEKHPETVLVFLSHGLMCLGCQGARTETVEEGAATHGIDFDALIKDLNAAVGEQSASRRK